MWAKLEYCILWTKLGIYYHIILLVHLNSLKLAAQAASFNGITLQCYYMFMLLKYYTFMGNCSLENRSDSNLIIFIH